MREITADCGSVQVIGIRHENGRTVARIPLGAVADIVAEYPGGSYTLGYRRRLDNQYWVCSDFVVEGDELIWTVGSHALGVAGDVIAQVSYSDGTVIAQTPRFRFTVGKSLFDGEEGQGENLSDLVEQAITAVGQVDGKIAKAEAEMDAAVAEKIDGALGGLEERFQERIDAAIEEIGEHVDLSGKADKADTVLDTTLSRGRTAGSMVGEASFAFGSSVIASGYAGHAEGSSTTASGPYSHAEGSYSIAAGPLSHAEGNSSTTDQAAQGHAEGNHTTVSAPNGHAEGNGTATSGTNGHSEGSSTTASGVNSHSEGAQTTASGYQAHSEGGNTTASGSNSHSEGVGTIASGDNSHSEGAATKATGSNSHSEGTGTVAYGPSQHAMGQYNQSHDPVSAEIAAWEAGKSYDYGDVMCLSGIVYGCKVPNSDTTFTASKWTSIGSSKVAFMIGNGVSNDIRHTGFAVLWDGSVLLGDTLLTEEKLQALIADAGQRYVIHAELSADGPELTADKTFAEVLAAVNAQKTPVIYLRQGGITYVCQFSGVISSDDVVESLQFAAVPMRPSQGEVYTMFVQLNRTLANSAYLEKIHVDRTEVIIE